MSDYQIFEDYFANLSNDILIEVELPPSRQKYFDSRYQSTTGEAVPGTTSQSPYYLLPTDSDKWGIELRIYFSPEDQMPPTLETLSTENSRQDSDYDEFSHRLNNNDIIWHLFANGFTLGRQ